MKVKKEPDTLPKTCANMHRETLRGTPNTLSNREKATPEKREDIPLKKKDGLSTLRFRSFEVLFSSAKRRGGGTYTQETRKKKGGVPKRGGRVHLEKSEQAKKGST